MSVLKSLRLFLPHTVQTGGQIIRKKQRELDKPLICWLKCLLNQTVSLYVCICVKDVIALLPKVEKKLYLHVCFYKRRSQPWMLLQTEEWRWVCPEDWPSDWELRPYWSVVFFVLCVCLASLSLHLFSMLRLLDQLVICAFGGRNHNRISCCISNVL